MIRELLVLDGLVLKDKFIRAYVEVSQKRLLRMCGISFDKCLRFVQSAIFPVFFGGSFLSSHCYHVLLSLGALGDFELVSLFGLDKCLL